MSEWNEDHTRGLLGKLAGAPMQLLGWMKSKAGHLAYEMSQAGTAATLAPHQEGLALLRKRLAANLKTAGSPQTGGGKHAAHSSHTAAMQTSLAPGAAERTVSRLRSETERLNRNNITRTAAYEAVYRAFPELHWALLAHLVSRNGGWTMTDLKGELIPHLLLPSQIAHTFELLERSNALIFHDAYPQLLLYRESRRLGKPLFGLLPKLGVSSFMQPVWELFWQSGDSALLTSALIVNEQHVIQKRVVDNDYYKKHVLDTLFFKSHSLLQLNQVVFPYGDKPKGLQPASREPERLRLAGLIVENFSSIAERIEIGRTLYAILFGIPDVRHGAERFVLSTPHSGSRADYWPHLYAPVRRGAPVPPSAYKERLYGCELKKGAEPLYSPRLGDVWKDVPMAPFEPGDWFDNLNVLDYFRPIEPPLQFEMSLDHCVGLNKLELAVIAGELFD